MNIFDLNTDVDVLYKDIGKIIYDSHCNVDTPTETLEAKIEEVDSKMGEILALREKIAALKDTKTCDACGAKCEKDT
ncbi:MAG: zinc ribbon domain-containing protein, partial [Clostridia bacterium]